MKPPFTSYEVPLNTAVEDAVADHSSSLVADIFTNGTYTSLSNATPDTAASAESHVEDEQTSGPNTFEDHSEASVPVNVVNSPNDPHDQLKDVLASDAEPFLLQSSPLDNDEAHTNRKARVSEDEDTEWEEAQVDDEPEGWSEIEG